MRFIKKLIFLCLILSSQVLLSDTLQNAIVRFGLVADVHYGDFQKSRRPENRASLEKFRDFIKTMNTEKVNFVLELGDFVGQGHPDEKDAVAWLDTIENEFAKFNGPRYHVLGNHEPVSMSKETFSQHITNTGILPGKLYYSFILHGIQFVILDSNFKSDGTPYGPGVKFFWTDAAIFPEELSWLTKTINGYNGKSIILMHHLLHNDDAKSNIRNGAEVREMLNASDKVLAVFSGHLHSGEYAKRDGVHYCVMKSMKDKPGLKNTSFAIIEIYPDYTIKIIGYGKEGNRILK